MKCVESVDYEQGNFKELSMVEIEGEKYHTVRSAAAFLNITRWLFYDNVRPFLQSHPLPGRKRRFYKQSDLETFRVATEVAA